MHYYFIKLIIISNSFRKYHVLNYHMTIIIIIMKKKYFLLFLRLILISICINLFICKITII
jgi:hypothetical protein